MAKRIAMLYVDGKLAYDQVRTDSEAWEDWDKLLRGEEIEVYQAFLIIATDENREKLLAGDVDNTDGLTYLMVFVPDKVYISEQVDATILLSYGHYEYVDTQTGQHTPMEVETPQRALSGLERADLYARPYRSLN